MLYSSRVMNDGSLQRYYGDIFGGVRQMQGQRINGRVNAMIFRRLLDGRAVRTVLDVGTGYGFFLKELRDRLGIPTLIGAELSHKQSQFGSTELGLDIRPGPLSTLGLGRSMFQMVTSFEVIEHTVDPRAFLTELVEYVEPGGHVLIMTDNFASEIVRSLGSRFPKWIPHCHISHFSPAHLVRLVCEVGLEPMAQASYDPWELVARDRCYRALGTREPAEQPFELLDALRSEMRGSVRLFWLRLLVNEAWARRKVRDDLDGAAMYLLARRPG
jgi:SAM-dependent methyltransferase